MVDNLTEECTENIDEKEIYPNETISHVCNYCRSSSCTIYIVLFAVLLTISIGIGTTYIYIYVHWSTKNESITDINPSTETVIYRVQFH